MIVKNSSHIIRAGNLNKRFDLDQMNGKLFDYRQIKTENGSLQQQIAELQTQLAQNESQWKICCDYQ